MPEMKYVETAEDFREYIRILRKEGTRFPRAFEYFLKNNPSLDPDLVETAVDRAYSLENIVREQVSEAEKEIELNFKESRFRRFYKSRTAKVLGAIGAGLSVVGAAFVGGILHSKKNLKEFKLAEPTVLFPSESSDHDIHNAVYLTYGLGDQSHVDVDGTRVVYDDGVGAYDTTNGEIFLYDTSTASKEKLPLSCSHPKISGERVICPSGGDLKILNLSNNEVKTVSLGYPDIISDPNIHGNWVVFEDDRLSDGYEFRIGLYNIPNEQITWISNWESGLSLVKPEISDKWVAWGNPIAGKIVVFNKYTATRQEISVGDKDYFAGEVGLSGDNLAMPREHGLESDVLLVNLNDGSEQVINTLYGGWLHNVKISGNQVLYGFNYINPSGDSIKSSIKVQNINSATPTEVFWSNLSLYTDDEFVDLNFDGNNIVWSARLPGHFDRDVFLEKTSGQAQQPDVFLYGPGDIQIQETSRLNYDPNAPAKFVLDAMFGTNKDFKFDYVQSDVVLFIKTNDTNANVYLILKTDGEPFPKQNNVIQSGSNPGELVFGGYIEKSTDSTGKVIGQEVLGSILEGFALGEDVVRSTAKGTVIGGIKAASSELPNVYIDKVAIDGQVVDIPDHMLSSVMNDPNIWNSHTEEFGLGSDADMKVYTENNRNIANDNNTVCSLDTHPAFCETFNPTEKYHAKIIGTKDGTYNFFHRKLDGLKVNFNDMKLDVKIKKGDVHINGLAPPTTIASSIGSYLGFGLIAIIPVLAGAGAIKYRAYWYKRTPKSEDDEESNSADSNKLFTSELEDISLDELNEMMSVLESNSYTLEQLNDMEEALNKEKSELSLEDLNDLESYLNESKSIDIDELNKMEEFLDN